MKTLYIDGLCEPRNPEGVGVAGFVVVETGFQRGEVLGYGPGITNNVAEYCAALKGLEYLVQQGEAEVLVRADSKLLVQQVNGIYAVNASTIQPLYERLQQLRNQFQKVNFAWVPAKENLADEVCWKAYINFMQNHPEVVRQYQVYFAPQRQVQQIQQSGLDRRYIGWQYAPHLLTKLQK